MLIDWFTVAAQAVNFLVLVWLLKRFLYKPVLSAIDAQEKLVASKLTDAQSREDEAHRERDKFTQRNADFDKQREDAAAKMTKEVSVQRDSLIEEAKKAADEVAAKRNESLTADARHLFDTIYVTCRKQVFSIARKALKDLAGVSLESSLGDVFAHQLTTLDDAAKWELSQAIKSSKQPATIKSAFDLPPDSRAAIQKILNETFSTDVSVTYETAPDLIGGIEFSTNGQQLAWSIDDYLKSMEAQVENLFDKRDAEASAVKST